ncbi:MAG: terpene cyclase/mutase family protein [Clostridia bacterium]|nr:terpene cyclase/mutase family protein [Clostridia bacterium]
MNGNLLKANNFKKVLTWIHNNTINGNGITVTSKEKVIYPEVTGYYIPSLLAWGEKDLAISYAKYLCSIQKPDGSWYDAYNKEPYVFDSAQILKGLISIREILPEVDEHIINGVDWILSNMHSDGRLTTPSKDAWGSDESFCSELIHIYCLTPIRDAGIIFNRQDYVDASKKILEYYKKNEYEKIMNFSLLSHFYAYVMEGLYDMGEIEMCREAMQKLEKFRNRKGGIPGLNDVPWVCSTGMFQLALVWYKLGELKKGDTLFKNACSLQNETGGWFGSYPAQSFMKYFYRGRKQPYYFSDAEISWADKYFLDALEYREKLLKQGK